jgi:tripartite-type tricarboxylate transporter receptor subunit TctC
MQMRKLFQWLLASIFAVAAGTAIAQDYPVRPLKMVIGFPPGGGIDSLSRVIAEEMSRQLGQPIVIDNRPGAGTAIATAEIIKSQPDGYTIGLGNVGQFSILEHISRQPIADLPRKIVGVGQVGYAPLALFVPANLAVDTIADYVKLARSQPDKLSHGSGGNGQITHLAFEMFKVEANFKMQHVPYKGSSAALTDLLGGRIHGMIDALGVGMPHVKSGKLKVLGITSADRAADFQTIPTFKESGYPNLVVTGWQGIVVPAGTPASIVQRLNVALNETLNNKAIKDKMTGMGYYPAPTTPPQFSALMKAESSRWGALCKALNIEAD